MARPLTKTYRPDAPYEVERVDEEDGSITYEVWDQRPDNHRRVCSINDSINGEEPVITKSTAKKDAEMIARGLNLIVARGKD